MTTSPTQGWRVKLYQLNGDGQWDDRGTGSISVTHMDVFGGPGVLVTSEEGGRDLLQSRILEDREAYSLQGENIITWEERLSKTSSVDLALSFQENEGCLHIWNQIQEVQGNYTIGGEAKNIFLNGREHEEDEISPAYDGQRYELKELPECRLNNLEEIRDQLLCPPVHRENVATMLMDGEAAYLKQLVGLFSDIEDLEDEENLKIMSHVMRAIVVLNDNRVLEAILLNVSLYEGVIGGIEYDPELQSKGTWRHFLEKQATFQEVVSMDDDVELRNNIHVAFRAALLRDAATRPGMDDGALTALLQYLYFTHAEIINTLIRHKTYLHKIIALCIGCDYDEESASVHVKTQRTVSQSRGLALRFLQEMCSIVKSGNIPMTTRDELFTYLIQELPLYEALTASLSDLSLPTREMSAATDVLSALVAFDQGSSFRLFILKKGQHPSNPSWISMQQAGESAAATAAESNGHHAAVSSRSNGGGLENCPPIPCKESLLSTLLHLIAHDDDLGCLLSYNEVLSKCVEVDTMESSERDAFLSVFYEHYIHWLVDPLIRDEHKERIAVSSEASAEQASESSSSSSYAKLTMAEKASRCHIADLLSYCLKSHTYRMRYFVLRNGLVARVIELCKQPEKYLKLAGLRFIRACVGAKDDFLNRHLVKKDHFALVFSVFVQNGARDNLISSAVIDIVEFIRTENITSLIKYAVEGFPGIFDNIDFVTTFKALKLKYDQNMEYERSKDGEEETTSNDDAKITALRKARAADDEEAYFDADDDDEDIPPSSSSSTTTTSSSPSAKLPESLSPPEGPLKLDLVRASTPPPPPFSPKSPREYDHDMNPTVMPPSENPLSPSYKARPLSPPILSKDTLLKDGSKDSLGMMFDMTKRAPVTNARNTVRKIEMVIGTSTVTPSDASPAEDVTSSSSENDVKRQKL